MDKNKLAELMGEKTFMRPTQEKYPIINLNGETGIFVKSDLEEDGKYGEKQEVGNVVEGVIIAVRQQLSEWTKNYQRSSNEYDSGNDKVVVWETAKGVRTKMAEGSIKELRENYQGLRSVYLLYALIGNEVIKIKVRGAGLSNLFPYFNELRDAGKHLFEVKTQLQPSQMTNESLKKNYWAPVFFNAGDVSEEEMEKVAARMEAFHSNLKALKQSYEEKAEIRPEDKEWPEEENKEVPF